MFDFRKYGKFSLGRKLFEKNIKTNKKVNTDTNKNITDIQYEQLLKVIFSNISKEEWEQYMKIVKKMYYSLEEISEEEMLYCYKCYLNCKK